MRCPNCNTKLKNDKNPYCIRCGFQDSKEMIKGINVNGLEFKKGVHEFLNKYFIILIIIISTLSLSIIFYKKELNKINSIISCQDLNSLNNKNAFVNELYISDERVYNNLLNDFEKDLYRNLFKGVKNFDESVIFNLDNINNSNKRGKVVKRVIDALRMDHPELIQVNNYEYYTEFNEILIKINYHYNKNEINNQIFLFKNRLDSIYNELNSLDIYDKVLSVYQVIGLNNTIGENNSAMAVMDPNMNPDTLAIASASQIIFQKIGIDSIIVVSNGAYRNMIKLDGYFYNFDASRYFSNQTPLINKISYSGFLFKEYIVKSDYKDVTPLALGNKYKLKKD